jgi:hypothetical protein
MSVGVMKDYKRRDLHASHTLGWSLSKLNDQPSVCDYLHQNKKKAEAKGKNCNAKTMWSLQKPI